MLSLFDIRSLYLQNDTTKSIQRLTLTDQGCPGTNTAAESRITFFSGRPSWSQGV